MPYVMVPVPAEHEAEVTKLLIQLLLQEALNNWNDASIAQLVGALGADEHRLLVVVAEGVLGRDPLTDRTAAEALDTTPEEVGRLTLSIVATCEEISRPSLVMMDPGFDAVPAGAAGVERSLSMAHPFAQMVVTAAGGGADPPAPE